jgi:hypothetical protein
VPLGPPPTWHRPSPIIRISNSHTISLLSPFSTLSIHIINTPSILFLSSPQIKSKQPNPTFPNPQYPSQPDSSYVVVRCDGSGTGVVVSGGGREPGWGRDHGPPLGRFGVVFPLFPNITSKASSEALGV